MSDLGTLGGSNDHKSVLRIILDTREYVRGALDFERTNTGIQNSLRKLVPVVTTSWWGIRALTDPLQAYGVAVGTAFVAMGRSAATWESAMMDVERTTAVMGESLEASRRRTDALSESILSMARRIPVASVELAKITEEAGALGIEGTERLTKFTEVISAIAVTTDLTADQATSDLARIASVMGVTAEDYNRLGSAVLAAGRSTAATEKEVVTFARRLAPAAKMAGFTADQLIGLAAAAASVGIKAEMGATALTSTLADMEVAVKSGGKELRIMATLAGESESSFRALYESDPSKAFTQFVEGLDNVQRAGGNVIEVLAGLGITEKRQTITLLALAAASKNAANENTQLSKVLGVTSQAYKDGNLIFDLAQRKYDTFNGQLQILKNQLFEVGLGFGNALLPAMKAVASAIQWMLEGFSKIPRPMQNIMATGTLVLAVVGLLVGTLTQIVAKATLARNALDKLVLVPNGSKKGGPLSELTKEKAATDSLIIVKRQETQANNDLAASESKVETARNRSTAAASKAMTTVGNATAKKRALVEAAYNEELTTISRERFRIEQSGEVQRQKLREKYATARNAAMKRESAAEIAQARALQKASAATTAGSANAWKAEAARQGSLMRSAYDERIALENRYAKESTRLRESQAGKMAVLDARERTANVAKQRSIAQINMAQQKSNIIANNTQKEAGESALAQGKEAKAVNETAAAYGRASKAKSQYNMTPDSTGGVRVTRNDSANIAGAAAGLGLMGAGSKVAAGGMKVLKGAITTVTKAFTILNIALIAMAVILPIYEQITSKSADATNDAAKANDALVTAMQKSGAEREREITRIMAERLVAEGHADAMKRLGLTYGDLAGIIRGTADDSHVNKVFGSLEKAAAGGDKEAKALYDTLIKLRKEYVASEKSAGELTEANKALGGSEDEANEAAAAAAEAVAKGEEAMKAKKERAEELVDATKNLIDAEYGVASGVISINKAMRDYVDSMRAGAAYSRELLRAEMSLAKARRDYYKSIRDLRKAEREVANARAEGAEAVAEAQRKYQRASLAAAKAQKELARARDKDLRDLREAEHDYAEAQEGIVEAREAIVEAELEYADSLEAVEKARKALDEARHKYTLKDITEATLKLASAQAKLRDSQRSLADAEWYLQHIREEGGTERDIADAEAAIEDAKIAVGEANIDLQESEENLTKVRKGYDPEELAKAERELADAQREVAKAQRGVQEALRGTSQAADKLAEAQEALADAQDRVANDTGFKEAQMELQEALAALADSQRDLVSAQQEAAGNTAYLDALDNLKDAQDAVAEAAMNAKEKEEELAKLRANNSAIETQQEAYLQLKKALYDQAKQATESEVALRKLRDGEVTAADEALILADNLRKMASLAPDPKMRNEILAQADALEKAGKKAKTLTETPPIRAANMEPDAAAKTNKNIDEYIKNVQPPKPTLSEQWKNYFKEHSVLVGAEIGASIGGLIWNVPGAIIGGILGALIGLIKPSVVAKIGEIVGKFTDAFMEGDWGSIGAMLVNLIVSNMVLYFAQFTGNVKLFDWVVEHADTITVDLGRVFDRWGRNFTKWSTDTGKEWEDGLNRWWKSLTDWNTRVGKGWTDALDGLWRSVTNWNTRVGEQWVKFGEGILDGIKQGLLDKWRSFKETWNMIVRAIPGAAQAGWEIHSPSRLFKRIAMQFMEGGIEGFKAMYKPYMDAASYITNINTDLGDLSPDGDLTYLQSMLDLITRASVEYTHMYELMQSTPATLGDFTSQAALGAGGAAYGDASATMELMTRLIVAIEQGKLGNTINAPEASATAIVEAFNYANRPKVW